MDNQADPSSEDYVSIAEKVRSGEYFREAQGMYDLIVHDLMTERYLYILISTVAIVILCIALYCADALYPLQSQVPFIVNSNNIVDDLPHIRTLLDHKGENPSEALLRFRVENYVKFREEYDIDTFDRNISGVQSQSSDQVFKEFQQQVDPRNPESPITLYQRYSTRKVDIISTKRLKGQEGMEVTFEASVESKTDVKKSRWVADITFNYNGIELDEKTDKVKPISFIVTGYHTKRL